MDKSLTRSGPSARSPSTSTCRSTYCASGKRLLADQAAEARRRPTVLPAGRRRPPARHPSSALRRGLHHQGRAAHPQGGGPALRAVGRPRRRARPVAGSRPPNTQPRRTTATTTAARTPPRRTEAPRTTTRPPIRSRSAVRAPVPAPVRRRRSTRTARGALATTRRSPKAISSGSRRRWRTSPNASACSAR